MSRILLCSLLLTPILLAGDGTAPNASAVDFLKGSWKAEKWGGDFFAYYSTAEGGMVLGHSELRKGEALSFYEFEKFHVENGKLTATPYPGGKQAPSFLATKVEKNSVTFENPDKDFPTRIVYALAAPNRLVITLTDPHHQSDQTEVFDFERVKAKSKK